MSSDEVGGTRDQFRSWIQLDAHAGNPSNACEIESTMRSKVQHVRVTPRRFRPGFEKHVNRKGMIAVYTAFPAGLAIAAIARDRRR
jgi:hypothetical protein